MSCMSHQYTGVLEAVIVLMIGLVAVIAFQHLDDAVTFTESFKPVADTVLFGGLSALTVGIGATVLVGLIVLLVGLRPRRHAP